MDSPENPNESPSPLSDPRVSAETAAASQFAAAHPDQIGPYRILEVLGEGGMGTVYLAEQRQPVRRRVALKLIKLGMDTREVISRFESERQALAVMNHPNVAAVYDAGATDAGRPYFVMEHVAGEPITKYCDRHRLTIRARLELFMQVCEAVQHAHQKGIIHRDLKPSNVLVAVRDGKAVPKVIDFGVAKATNQRLTEHTVFTEQGRLIGTPEYMSPEQAEMTSLDIDTRTDVYSLGVMLYELLAGTLPFESAKLRVAGYAEVQRIIREVDPPKPSTRFQTLTPDTGSAISVQRRLDARSLHRLLRGELDWITIKAMDKDPARRYASPHEFGTELGRYLKNLPVLAGPPGSLYRIRKLIRRNRAATVGGITVAGALLLGGIGTTWGMVVAQQQRGIARAEATAARAALGEAEAITSFLTDDLLGAAEPSTRAGRGREVTVREVLDSAARQVELESQAGGKLHGLTDARVRLLLAIGRTYSLLTIHERALETLTRARNLADSTGDGRRWIELSIEIAKVYEDLGAYRDCEATARSAFERSAEELGRNDPLTLDAQSMLALALYDLDQYEPAEALYRDVIDRMRRLPEYDESDEPRNNLAILLLDTNRTAEAIPLLEQDLRLCTENGDDIQALTVRGNLALAYDLVGRTSLAIEMARDVEAQSRKLLGPRHTDTLLAIQNRAMMERDYGSPDVAIPLMEEVLAGHREAFGANDPYTVHSACVLASFYLDAGSTDAAKQLARDTARYADQLLVRGDADALDSAGDLADLLVRIGDAAEAIQLSEHVFAARKREFSDAHPAALEELVRHIELLLRCDQVSAAQALLEGPVAVEAQRKSAAWAPCPSFLSAKGAVLTAATRFREAEQALLLAAQADPPHDDGELRQQVIERIVALYRAWNTAEPDLGLEAKADTWSAKLGSNKSHLP